MEIIHRISFNAKRTPEFVEELDRLEIISEQGIDTQTEGLIVFEISESDARWELIERFHQRFGGVHFVQTYFTDDEIVSSEIVRLLITYQEGYPQPKSTWVSTKPNYEVLCSRCGILRQKETFSIQSEPKLRGHSFMTLIWGSAIFAEKEVVHILAEKSIKGFQPWEVRIHGMGEPSDQIQQLYPLEQSAPGMLDGEDVGYEECEECGERKYFVHTRGAMKYRRSSFPDDIDMLQSH